MTPRIAYAPYFLALAIVFSPAAASAQNDMCVPWVGGLAGTPRVDGIVDGYTGPALPPAVDYDPGWNGATRWNLSGDHGATTATKLQAGYDGAFLYLSYVVDTPAYGQDNTIVIGFAETLKPASTNWRIFITPSNVANPADGAGKTPVTALYWRDGAPASPTYWNNGQTGTNDAAHWTYTNTRWSRSGSRWALEIKIPVTHAEGADAALPGTVYLPGSGVFRFYTSVVNTYGFVPPMMVVQDPWPLGVEAGTGDILANLIPAPNTWGQMSFNMRAACTGVKLTWADVGVLQPPSGPAIVSAIQRSAGAIVEANIGVCNALANNHPGPNGPVNKFVARPRSDMVPPPDPPPPPPSLPSPGVSATFRIANWGIPAPQEWAPIGAAIPSTVTGNPTAPATINQDPAPPVDLIAQWTLNYKQSCQVKFQPHQCIQVDLDSNHPGVRFKNKSVQRNMDFVPLSRYERTAHISGDWGKVLGRDRDVYTLAILVETQQQFTNLKPPASVLGPCDRPSFRHEELVATAPKIDKGAQLAWIARGILLGEDVIVVNGRKYRKSTRVGDFGYVGTHVGPFYGWNTSFTGNGLRAVPRTPGLYTIDVPRGRGADVVTVLEALEKRPQPPREPR